MKHNFRIFISFFALSFVISAPLSAELIFDKSEYAARRAKLMEKIPDGIAVILGAQDVTGFNEFFQNNDFMYLCGVDIPNSILIIDGVRKETTLFFSISDRQANGENISLELVHNPREYTGIERYSPRESFSSQLYRLSSRVDTIYTSFKPQELMREVSNEKFATLRENMMVDEWDGRLTRELKFVQHLTTRFPQVEVKDCSEMIWDLRIYKSPAEIELMREAGRIGVKALREMMKSTQPGMYEYEVEALYEYMCKKEGIKNQAYIPIISSEENQPYLHYHKFNRLLEDGDFLVVDAGPDVSYYDVDISISYPANGKFTPRQREIYEACYEIEKACISFYKPGITCSEVNDKVINLLKQKGFDLNIDAFKIMTRGGGGCSHYVGMAVHDVGGSTRGLPLKEGMVFACDILAVFPDENLGVRVEDTVLITKDGCENLTPGLPRSIEEIEALMKNKGIVQILKDNNIYK
ncbi:aminopeptidase P N-terminal domain-containing protein [Acidobacteriota bacterium]